MAQLRQDYERFRERSAEVVAVGPDDHQAFREFWAKNDIPFVGLADPDHRVSSIYGQEVKITRMGRMPAQFVIDSSGTIRFSNYGQSMRDIARDAEVLAVLDEINAAAADER